MNRILLSIIRKEFIHIIRDKQTLVIAILMPIMMLFLYGYAINMEMKQIDVGIADLSATPQSRKIIERLTSNDFFNITIVNPHYKDYEEIFKFRKVRALLIIPEDYATKLELKHKAALQLLIDASDPNAANYINNYFSTLTFNETLQINRRKFNLFTIEPRILYNPDMRSANFFVPGLIAVILILVSALLTSIAVVREKENGTMEQLMVSPVQAYQIIIGKVLPYSLLGYINGVMILTMGSLIFNVHISGSILFVNLVMLIYVITGMSVGLLISTVTSSQQIALMATLMLTILPTVLLSGFIFPVQSMPEILQYISYMIPATYFLEIIRGVILKGNGMAELYQPVLTLSAITLFLLGLSIKKFKSGLEL
jgi:ABC-2 type transport system permease protein